MRLIYGIESEILLQDAGLGDPVVVVAAEILQQHRLPSDCDANRTVRKSDAMVLLGGIRGGRETTII